MLSINTQETSRPLFAQHWKMLLLIPLILIAGYGVLEITNSRVIVFVWMNFWFGHLSDVFWANVTFLVDTAAAFALVSLLLQRRERAVFAAIVGGIICGIVIRLLKMYFDDPRPPAVLNGSLFNVIGEAYRGHSFPSGHAATAFFISGLLIAFFKSQSAYWICLTFGVLGALSRVAVGVHWPTDILVGSAIGWVIGFASGLYFNQRDYFSFPKRWLVFTVCYLAAIGLLIYNPNMPYVTCAQAIFAFIGVFCSLNYLAFRILKV